VVERPTIVGVATGTPDGGVAIVRLSGPEAGRIGVALCGDLPPPRRASARAIELGDGERERGLVVWMPGPASFTGEDVLELHVHGGGRNVTAVVEAVLRAGAEPAGPGDFSRRAFELGRLGLDEAEGIAAVIGAQTEEALRQARRLAGGELGRDVDRVRAEVLELRAEIEANLDFPEDVAAHDVQRWAAEVDAIAGTVDGWLARFEAGRRARERARIVLAGPPNAGKSSLFNALLGRNRALVADVPGTTRDYVDADIEFGPYAATLVDTAGLRVAEDLVERAGVALTEDQLQGADVVIWVEASDAAPAEMPPALQRVAVVRVETKRDVQERRPDWLGVALVGGGGPPNVDVVRARLQAWFVADGSVAWIGLRRHRARAEDARRALTDARAHLQDAMTLELAAFALSVAQTRLGEVTGRSETGPVGAEVLDRIFARFCIGK
jgi:tRNA modification GTPase